MSQYEIDFTVLNKEGSVVCVIELDDPTHDTYDGKRRDKNKNTWLRQAGIPIIRIREPEEAENIRSLIDSYHATATNNSIPNNVYLFRNERKSGEEIPTGRLGYVMAAILLLLLLIAFAPPMLSHMTADIGNKITKQNQEYFQKMQQQQSEEARKRQQKEQLTSKPSQGKNQPQYEQVLVKAKPPKECEKENGNVLNNAAITCMRDHYETVLVNGNQ